MNMETQDMSNVSATMSALCFELDDIKKRICHVRVFINK